MCFFLYKIAWCDGGRLGIMIPSLNIFVTEKKKKNVVFNLEESIKKEKKVDMQN